LLCQTPMIAPANAGLISMRVNSQNHPQKDTMIFSKQNAIGTSPTVHYDPFERSFQARTSSRRGFLREEGQEGQF
jgi:hypothetical protein